MEDNDLKLEDIFGSSHFSNDADGINLIAIIGAGVMGQGLAQTIAGSGMEVIIVEKDS